MEAWVCWLLRRRLVCSSGPPERKARSWCVWGVAYGDVGYWCMEHGGAVGIQTMRGGGSSARWLQKACC